MKDNSGKVILALLAGASAGIVAGLLMAPEAGTATRETWGKSLGKFGDDLNKLLQDGLSKLDALKGGASGSDDDSHADRSGAEDALAGMGSGSNAGRSGKNGGKTGNGGAQSTSGGQSASAGTGSSAGSSSSSGDAGASTASSSRPAGNDAAGGTAGGSGVGS